VRRHIRPFHSVFSNCACAFGPYPDSLQECRAAFWLLTNTVRFSFDVFRESTGTRRRFGDWFSNCAAAVTFAEKHFQKA
jgi:hypothetical protein